MSQSLHQIKQQAEELAATASGRETALTADDVIQLKRIHAGERNTVMVADVERWRVAGWLEPEPSWKLTRLGLAAICWSDPGPDLCPEPVVRPRTPEEVHPARDALRRLSDVLLRHENPGLRALGRLAWLHSVLPLSTPEEVAYSLAFAGGALVEVEEPNLRRGLTIPEEHCLRQAALGALSSLGFLVDAMHREVVEAATDRRRSVAASTLSQLEREWDAVPVEEVEMLLRRARAVVEVCPCESISIDNLAGAVARVDAIRKAVSSRT